MAEGLSTKYTIDITDLQAGLTKANREIRANETEWKQNALTMEDWENTTEGVSSRIKALDKTMDIQKGKVNALKKEQERLIREGYDPLSPAVADVTQKLNSAQNELMKTQKESQKYNKILSDMKNKQKDVASSADEASGGFTVMKGAIAGVVSQAITGLVSSIGSAVSSLWNLTEATQEYRTEMAKLSAVATEAGASADEVKDAWMTTASVLNDPQAVTEGINNLLTAGFTAEEEMDAITKGLEGASIRWKDTLKFEGLSDSLQEWIGSDGANLSGSFAEMLERMGYSIEEVQAQTAGMTDEQRKQWAITTLQKEGLNDLSDTYREQNAEMIKMNEANLKMQDSQARLAEMMIPFQATFKSAWADILTSAMDVAEGVEGAGDELIYNIGYMGGQVVKGIKDIIGFATPIIQNLMPSVITTLEASLPAFISKGTEVISNLLTGMGEKMPEVLTGITNLLADILLTISEEAPKLLASAGDYLGGIVNAIPQIVTTLGERLPEIINTISNGLFSIENKDSLLNSASELLSKIVEAIPSTVTNLLTELPKIINSILDAVGNAIPNLLLKAGELFDQIVDAIPAMLNDLSAELPKILGTILDKFIEFAPDILAGAWDLFKKVIEAVPKILGDLAIAIFDLVWNIGEELVANKDEIIQAGKDLMLGLVDGIKDAWNSLKTAVVETKDKVVGWFKEKLGINSPSTVMADAIGKFIPEGIAQGMEDGQSGISSAVTDTANNLLGWFKDKLGIHSPAKLLADEVGAYVSQGIAVGMIDGEHYILDSAGNIVDDSTALLIRGYVDAVTGGTRQMAEATAEAVENAGQQAVTTAGTKGEEAGIKFITSLEGILASKAQLQTNEIQKFLDAGYQVIEKEGKYFLADEAGNIMSDADAELARASIASLEAFKKSIEDKKKAIKDSMTGLLNNVLTGDFEQAGSNMASALVDTLSLGLKTSFPALSGVIDMISPALKKIGSKLINAIWDGLKSMWENVKGWFRNIGQGIKDWWNGLWGKDDKDESSKPEEKKIDISGILTDPLHATQEELNEAIGVLQNLGMSTADINKHLGLESDTLGTSKAGTVVVNQTNNYSQQHSRYEIWQSKNDTARAVKLAVQGV